MRIVVLLSLLFVGGACGKRAVGEYCSASSECQDGTSCIQSGSQDIGDGGLVCGGQMLCSITCTQDSDCVTALGAGHICLNDCFAGSCVKGSSGG